MNKLNRWLLVLLAAQLIIALIVYVVVGSNDVNYKSTPLISFDKSQLTKLVIINGNDEQNQENQVEQDNGLNKKLSSKAQVLLVKQTDGWVLPQLNHLPINQEKFDFAVGKLMGLKSSWPVATTEDSLSRFEVAEDQYKKKIQLFNGEHLLGELFIGTSPGFKKIHLRKASENEIYSLELNDYDFPVDSNDWLNKAVLQIENITQISYKDFSLQKSNKQWSFSPDDIIESGKQIDSQKVENLLGKLASFNVIEVERDPDKANAAETQIIKVLSDKKYELSFYRQESDYWVKRNDIDTLFSISSIDYNVLAEVKQGELIKDIVGKNSGDTVNVKETQGAEDQSVEEDVQFNKKQTDGS